MPNLSDLSELFPTIKEKMAITVIASLIILVPATSFVISKRQNIGDTRSKASYDEPITQNATTSAREVPKTSPLKDLKDISNNGTSSTPNILEQDSAQVSFGPTLSFRSILEGRPQTKQAAKMFVGIAQGQPTINPTFLLTFYVNTPDSGDYSGISLAGLNVGDSYTAYLKGPAQIATASAFVVKPTVSDLSTITLLSGDLNEDNIINSSDYSIAKAAYGTRPQSQNWNPNIDLNLDGIVNNFDLAFIVNNFGKTGASGNWYSSPPKIATVSGGLKSNTGQARDILPAPLRFDKSNSTSSGSIVIPGDSGYWMFIPKD